MVNKTDEEKKTFYSVSEAAAIIGISRTAVHKRITSGKIRAEKVGRAYVIPTSELTELAAGELTGKMKTAISGGVTRVLEEYGETLRLLGKE